MSTNNPVPENADDLRTKRSLEWWVSKCTPEQYETQLRCEINHLDSLRLTKRHKGRIAAQERRIEIMMNAAGKADGII
ncbi:MULTISPECIES: hypothetical protein [unclassified Halomonas]|uniref:hypothetical protein n=1 Tax=unclassified Halomonas TaxID=2609666 RepID=UPI0020A1ADBB|nr:MULTISPECIES: hypothetical protein [unclassified Halomonas]MCP1312993.1 hypothetical protein [Halomonas sp. 707D7]MCP1326160.1 hypothetical protein [Halomonas sp. 707D4]